MLRTNSRKQGGKYYTRYLMHYARRNYAFILLAALFLSGALFGTLLVRTAGEETIALLVRIVNGYVEQRREQAFLQNIILTSASSLVFIAALFVCSFCAISQPIILLLPFLRGLGFGFSAGSLYARYGSEATGFVSLFILPDMLISSVAILICAREALRLSGDFLGFATGAGRDETYPLRIFIGRYIASAILCVISAFIESFLHFSFANYFFLG